MRKIKKCIFCKQDSTGSNSIEHIIPESLGNDDLILDKGIVCDKCNNYFSREIEGPVLNLDGFKQLRFYELIESKRGRIPTSDALFCGENCDIHWQKINGEYSLMIGLSPETIYKLFKNPPKMFLTRGFNLDDKEHKYEISRFLSKIAVEFYVYLYLQAEDIKNTNEDLDLQFDEQLTKIINYIRLGRKDKKALDYKVTIQDNYKPLSGTPTGFQIGFVLDTEDLILDLTISNTNFKLNLTKASL